MDHHTPKTPYVGRRQELATLQRLASSGGEGAPRVVLLVGEAGIGKSRLAAELSASFARSPAGPVDAAPLVETVEDIHLLDEEAIAALGERGAAGDRRLVVATLRAGVLEPGSDRRRALLALRRRDDVSELHVPGLSVDEVAELLEALGADRDPTDIHERTGGNPFFVHELARAHGDDVPWTIREMVTEQTSGLAPADQHALTLLAVAGGPVPVGALRAVEPETNVTALVERCLVDHDRRSGSVRLRHGVVADGVRLTLDTGSVQAAHRQLAEGLARTPDADHGEVWQHLVAAGDHVRARSAAVAAALAADERGRAQQATTWFERALDPIDDSDPQLLGRAAAAAGTVGRVELAERWARAADRRFRAENRPEEAERMWSDRSLRYIRRPGAISGGEALAGRAEQAELAARAGDVASALSLAAQVLADSDPLADSDAAARAALARYMAGEPGPAVAALERLRNVAFDAGDARVEAWRAGDLAACAAGLGDVSGGIGHERSGLTTMAGLDDDMLVPSLHVGLACLLGIAGELEQTRSVIADLAAHKSPFTGLLSLVPDMIVAISEGRHEDALRNAGELAPFKDVAGPYLFGIVLIVEGYAHFMTGDLDATTRVLDELDRWVGGVYHQTIPIRLELRIRVAAATGDTAGLKRLITTADALAGDPAAGPGLRGDRELGAGLLVLAEGGDPAEAADRLQHAGDLLARSPRLVPAGLAWCDASEAAILAGDGDRARALLARVDGLIQDRGIRALRPRTVELRARLDGTAVELTPRERQLMVLLARGLTNKDIASALNLSPKTVRNQLHTLFAKLGVSRRAEVAALAVRLGLPDEPDTSRPPT